MLGTNFGRDFRTWMLLLVALVPPASVLVGALWLWSAHGAEIDDFDAALVAIDTSYEVHHAAAFVLRSEATLRAAALPGADAAVVELAANDRAQASEAVRSAQSTIPPLVEAMGSDEDPHEELAVLSLIGESIGLASEVLQNQTPGVSPGLDMRLIATLARDNAGGLVLPYVRSDSAEIGQLYDTLAATLRYHDQYDRDRDRILDVFEAGGSSAQIQSELESIAGSELRLAEWRDLIVGRAFGAPVVTSIEWFAQPVAQTPTLIERVEPVDDILALGAPTDAETRDAMLTSLFAIEDELTFDLRQAIGAIRQEADDYLDSLRRERGLMLAASAVMTLLGTGLAALTVSEVRHRRRVEHAHEGALGQLAEKAHRDPTTGAWNRRRLESELEGLLRNDNGHQPVVLAYVDLDHFKAINDVWGHHTGDGVLRTVTRRLTRFEYDGVAFELTRFGGDEFVLFAAVDAATIEWLEGLGEAIIDTVGSQMAIGGREHIVGVSVGISVSERDSTIASLLLEADSSLILAKREQRGSAVVYNRDISRTGELVHALPQALSDGEIACHFQPVVDLATGEIVHVEALARWTRRSGELVSPIEFVPLVESYGLSERLTEAVLRSAHHFINAPTTPSDVRVWVNISPRELDIANFARRFVTMVRRENIDPTRLGIEITESAAVRDPLRLGAELRALRDRGVSVAIDDFGSGYSPLGHLRDLAADTVKLDRSLIAGIDHDKGNQALVEGIVGLLREIGATITAEGVERVEEEEWLIAQGITRVQGYLWGRPAAAQDFRWALHRSIAERTLTPGG